MTSHRRRSLGLAATILATLVAGSGWGAPTPRETTGRTVLAPMVERYVAIGTSVSSGWRSDGITRETQHESWPSQLARLGGRSMTLADLDRAACRSPIVAPIALARRLDGTSVLTSGGAASCRANAAPNVVDAPPANLALPGARTRNALISTPESATGRHAALYRLILPPGTTQVGAMEAQRPTLVSIELGANEVFGVYSGVVESEMLVSFTEWKRDYDTVLERVGAVTDHLLLVGLVDSLTRLPGFRRGDELWKERIVLRFGFHVSVSPGCRDSGNLVFVPLIMPRLIADGLARRERGEPPAMLDCEDRGRNAADNVLTPADEARVNAQLTRMNAHIHSKADWLGYAHVGLDALYQSSETAGSFSVMKLMFSPWPFGPFVSVDGLHPSAVGNRALAEAAARAIAARYVAKTPGSAFATRYPTP